MKYVVCALMALVATGCATNSDGSVTMGLKGSIGWHESAPRKDIEAYYDAMEVHQLCITWADKYNRTDVRNEISSSLRRRGMNPLLCY